MTQESGKAGKGQPFRMPVKWEDLPRFPVRDFVSRSGFRGENVMLVMNWLEPGMEIKVHSHPFEQIVI